MSGPHLNLNSSANTDGDANAAHSTPGLVASHAQYAKGAAEEAIGNVTGSQAWQRSGVDDKEHAVHDMKAAAGQRDAGQGAGLGGVEEKLGGLVGCEGMVREGGEKTKK